jgi:hypothetical protein
LWYCYLLNRSPIMSRKGKATNDKEAYLQLNKQ